MEIIYPIQYLEYLDDNNDDDNDDDNDNDDGDDDDNGNDDDKYDDGHPVINYDSGATSVPPSVDHLHLL